MKVATAQQLINLNKRFYQEFAASFSQTRQRLQPGVMRILEVLPPDATLLDLGSGNGELARQLIKRKHQGQYLGMDFSIAMLKEADRRTPNSIAKFQQADLSSKVWHKGLAAASFDRVLCFATLHHIPRKSMRLRFLSRVRELLSPDGRFIFSTWQFLNSERLKARIQPWKVLGLSAADVEAGDYLLDWRRDGVGLRYVHHYRVDELEALAHEIGFEVAEVFVSDGEGGDLGLYQVWKPSRPAL